jgi:hypothetical protein
LTKIVMKPSRRLLRARFSAAVSLRFPLAMLFHSLPKPLEPAKASPCP